MTLRPANDVADEIMEMKYGDDWDYLSPAALPPDIDKIVERHAHHDRISAALTAREREVRAACKAIATDRFYMPPEHDGEAVAVHNGWEMCARTIAARIAALEEEKP